MKGGFLLVSLPKWTFPLLSAALLSAPTLPAQAGRATLDSPKAAREGKKAKAKKKRLRWPRLSPKEKRAAKAWIVELAHKKPEVARRAEERLKDLGPGAIPLLVSRMSDVRPERNQALERISLALIRKEEAPLAARLLFHHLACVRGLAADLLRRAGNPSVRADLEKALAEEKDPKVRERMVLALCALGDTAGLPGLFEIASKDFFGRRGEILASARNLKGGEAEAWLLAKLSGKDRKEQITALRLLALAGTRKAVPAVAAFLDSKNHALALEAINTLRSIVDGKKPMKHIGVFQLIQLRNEWKARVAGKEGR